MPQSDFALPPPLQVEAASEAAWLPNSSHPFTESIAKATEKRNRRSWNRSTVVVGAAVPVLLIAAIAVYQAWPRSQVSSDEQSAAAAETSSLASDLPAKTVLRPGLVVELTGPKEGPVDLCADEAIFVRYQPKTPRIGPDKDKDVFSVNLSDLAMLLLVKKDRLQVRLLEGRWKNRVGWIAANHVRLPPTPPELAGNVVEGIDLGRRREIYGELYRLIVLAEFEANSRFPWSQFESSPGSYGKNQSLLRALEEAAPKSIVGRYRQLGLDEAQLNRIDAEGRKNRWPLPEVPPPYAYRP